MVLKIIKCFGELRNHKFDSDRNSLLPWWLSVFARFRLLRLTSEIIVKRSLSSLAIIFDFQSINARVNCHGFVLRDGHAFITPLIVFAR